MEELLRLPELIETLWNVNSIDVVIDNIRDIELIETLWNVNAISVLDCAFNASRINRNIVECKFY